MVLRALAGVPEQDKSSLGNSQGQAGSKLGSGLGSGFGFQTSANGKQSRSLLCLWLAVRLALAAFVLLIECSEIILTVLLQGWHMKA